MQIRIFSTWAMVMIAVIPSFGKCSPKLPSTLPITSTFFRFDAANAPTDIQSDGLDGDTYYNGVDSVSTYLTCNGYNGQAFADWQFDALSSSVRRVSISFANPIYSSAGGTATPNPPFSVASVIAHVEDKCSQIANGNGYNNMLQMRIGQSFQCPLIVHFFASNNGEYRIYMGPNWEPESTFVQITCNNLAIDNSGCNDWFVDPIPLNGSPGQAIGRLVYFGRRITVNEGDFYFRLHFHLTRP